MLSLVLEEISQNDSKVKVAFSLGSSLGKFLLNNYFNAGGPLRNTNCLIVVVSGECFWVFFLFGFVFLKFFFFNHSLSFTFQ